MSGKFHARLLRSQFFADVEPALISAVECTNGFLANPNMWKHTVARKYCIFNCSVDLTSSLFVCALTKSNVSITPTGQGVSAVRLVSMETLQRVVLRPASPAPVLEPLPATSEFMSQSPFNLCQFYPVSIDNC